LPGPGTNWFRIGVLTLHVSKFGIVNDPENVNFWPSFAIPLIVTTLGVSVVH
jgi:hypothetical protein